jgi:hypothetical protein
MVSWCENMQVTHRLNLNICDRRATPLLTSHKYHRYHRQKRILVFTSARARAYQILKIPWDACDTCEHHIFKGLQGHRVFFYHVSYPVTKNLKHHKKRLFAISTFTSNYYYHQSFTTRQYHEMAFYFLRAQQVPYLTSTTIKVKQC